MEGTLLKCLFQTAHYARNSKDVDVLKFQLVHHDTFYNGQNQQDSTECLLMLINIIHKGSMPDSSSTTYPMGASLSDTLFWKNILSAMYVDWGPPHLSLVVCYIFHLLIPLPCKTWFYKDCNRNCKNPALDVIRTLGTSNQAIYYNLQNNCFSSLITKDRCSIPMDTTVRLGPLKFSLRVTIDHHGPSIHSGHYTASINCCKKHSIATITQLRSLELLIAKTPLLHMLYYMNWLTYEFWTRTGGWEFDRSHGAGTSSPSHWQQVEEQAPKPVGWRVGWCVSSWWPLFPSRSCVIVYIYIYICILYMSFVIGRI